MSWYNSDWQKGWKSWTDAHYSNNDYRRADYIETINDVQ